MKILCLAVLLAVCAIPFPIAKDHSDKTPHRGVVDNGKAEKTKPAPPSFKSQEDVTSAVGADHECQKREDPKLATMSWTERANAVSTIVVAAFAAVTAFFIGLQIKSARDANRAWVLVSKVVGPPDGRWYVPENPGFAPGAVFEIKVYGKTPVRVIKCGFRLQTVPAKPGNKPPEPKLPFFPDYKINRPNPEIPKNGRIMYPEAALQARLFIEPKATLSEPEWESLRDGKTILCAYGIIKYRDAFGRRKKTRTCYIWNFAWGGGLKDPAGNVLNPAEFRIGGPSRYNYFN